MSEQNAVLRITWRGQDLVAAYASEDNLGVAGLHVGPFYVDYDPIHCSFFGCIRGVARFWLNPRKLWFRAETASHHLVVFPGFFKVR